MQSAETERYSSRILRPWVDHTFEAPLQCTPSPFPQAYFLTSIPALTPTDNLVSPNRAHLCEICGKAYGRRQELIRHRRDKHEPWSICGHCGDFRWCRRDQFRKHLEEKHPNGDPNTMLGRPTVPYIEATIIPKHSLKQKVSSTDEPQCVDAHSTTSSSTQEHPPMSQSSPSRILIPPDKLHPILSCWIKNMDKLSGLINGLEELASSAPAEHQSQLLIQVMALRAKSKKQQEHFIEFLQLSEEYANKYLLDISAEIEQQSFFLEKLEGRVETAKKLREEAVDLQRFYESETVATMENLPLPRPLPEDHALFSEVESVLAEIRRCYMEMDRFWTDEVSRAIEALKMRRVDPNDFERWNTFHANLKHAIESWKNENELPQELPSGGAQTLRRNVACPSKERDIGAIASTLSSAAGSLTSALDRIHSSNSMKYLKPGKQSGPSSIQGVYVAFAANKDLCLSFLQHCFDYGEEILALCLPSIASPTSARVGAPNELRERTMKLRSEMTGVSTESAAGLRGSRRLKATYKKALSLEQKTTSGLNLLVEGLSSWVTITCRHGLRASDDALLDAITLKQHRELWVKTRDSIGVTLTILKNEPASQSIHSSAPPLASTKRLSVMKRWLMNLLCFS